MQGDQDLIDEAVASAYGEKVSSSGLNELFETAAGQERIGDDFELCFTLDDLHLRSSEARDFLSLDPESDIERNEKLAYAKHRIEFLELENDGLPSFHCVGVTDSQGRRAFLCVRGDSLGQGGLSFSFISCIQGPSQLWDDLRDKGFFRLGLDLPTDAQILKAWTKD